MSIIYRIIAALTLFTRLPLWRLCNVPREYYERVTPLWPLAGYATGAIMSGIFFVAAGILPLPVAVILALAARILTTGALHEDGFADFCDGFGGGTTRERTLDIMKDSHIGTYGVLGLIVYFLAFYNVLTALIPTLTTVTSMPVPAVGAMLFFCLDPLAKMLCSTIVWFLAYARKESEAKTRIVYASVPFSEKVLSIVLGILPTLFLFPSLLFLPLSYAFLCAVLVTAYLFCMMHRRLQGYTGDCCGATSIIVEFSLYLSFLAFTGML